MVLITEHVHGDYETAVDDQRLIAIVRNTSTGKTIRRFTGETAWSDAERYADDLALADRYK